MEKYTYLKELTRKHLNGDLTTLRMDYNSTQNTVVNVIYEDYNKYRFNYAIEINKETKETSFLNHNCEYISDKIILKRSKVFEKAVHEYLFDQI